MASKQPIYDFSLLTSIGIFNIPTGSLVSIQSTGELFTLTSKAGLGPNSTLADAMARPQN